MGGGEEAGWEWAWVCGPHGGRGVVVGRAVLHGWSVCTVCVRAWCDREHWLGWRSERGGGVRAGLVCGRRGCGVDKGFGPRVWLAQCVAWRVRLCVCVCEGVGGGGGEDGADEWVGWRVGEGEWEDVCGVVGGVGLVWLVHRSGVVWLCEVEWCVDVRV